MPPYDHEELARVLGEIEGRLTSLCAWEARIEAMLIRFDDRHLSCRSEIDSRLRACEQTRAQAIAVGGIVGALAGLSSWFRELWR